MKNYKLKHQENPQYDKKEDNDNVSDLYYYKD